MKTSFKNSSGKIIGKVSGDVFSKRVLQSKHLFRALDAWGIDKSVLDSLVRKGVQKIVIYEKEGDIDYEVCINRSMSHSEIGVSRTPKSDHAAH